MTDERTDEYRVANFDRLHTEYVALARDHGALQHDYALLVRDNAEVHKQTEEMRVRVEGWTAKAVRQETRDALKDLKTVLAGVMEHRDRLEIERDALALKVRGYEAARVRRSEVGED